MNNKLLLVGMLAFVLLAPATAILNTKSYDSATDTLTIKDWLGLSDYEKVKFISEDYSVASAEIIKEITPAQSMTPKDAFGKIEFIAATGKDLADKKVSYEVLYETTEKYQENETTWTECEHKADAKNASDKDYKYPCITDSKMVDKERIVLKNFWDLKELTAKQTYKVHMKLQRQPNLIVDWIATYGGLRASEKSWWNTTWAYNKQILIHSFNGTIFDTDSNISIKMNISTYSLMAAGKAQYDCGDLRFIEDYNNGTYWELGGNQGAYYIEYCGNTTGSPESIVWIRPHTLAADNTTFAMYYNATTAQTSKSDINGTFIFGDDIESGTGKWTWAASLGTGAGYYWTGIVGAGYSGYQQFPNAQEVTIEAMVNPNSAEFNYQVYDGVHDQLNMRISGGAFQYIADGSGWTGTGISGSTGTWYKLFTKLNSGGTSVWLGYINGTNDAQAFYNGTHTGTDARFRIYADDTSDRFDNIFVYRWITPDIPFGYWFGAETSASTTATTTLVSPANGYNSSSSSITFNCSFTAGTGSGQEVQNITLGIFNSTTTTWVLSGDLSSQHLNNYSYQVSVLTSDGNYSWNALGCDDLNCTWAAANKTFTIDTVAPVVNAISPSNNSEIITLVLPCNTTLNATQTDINLNSCWWTNSTANCYQETANSKTSTDGNYCGIKYTGNYGYNIYWSSPANLYDGNWNTYSQAPVSPPADFWVNYTIPSGASSAKWEVKIYNSAYGTNIYSNISIPSTCLEHGENKIVLLLDQTSADCVQANGTILPIMSWPVSDIYEERIIWNPNTTALINNLMTCNSPTSTNYTDSGWKTVVFFANDTYNNTGSSNSTTFLINYAVPATEYTNPLPSDALTNPININITANLVSTISGTLWYNGTSYATTASVLDSTHGRLTVANVPHGDNLDKTFYWNITLDGSNFITSTYTQSFTAITAPEITDGLCSSGMNLTRYYTFADESNRTTQKEENVEVNLVYGILNSSAFTTNKTLSLVSNVSICINGTAGNYSVSYFEIQYSKSGYFSNRYYPFTIAKLTQEPISTTLYQVLSSVGTSVQFKFLTTQLGAYVGKYAALLRWYPGLDAYDTTAMGKTDDAGQTVMALVQSDVDYRYALYETDGTLIKLFDPTRKKCLDNPCTDTEQIDNSVSTTWPSIVGITYNLSFAPGTHTYTFIWNDPSATVQTMNLKVFKISGTNEISICNNYASGSTGVLSCSASAYNGTFRADVYRTASPVTPFTSRSDDTTTSIFRSSTVGLFVSLMLFLFIMLFGLYSPAAAVMFAIIGLVPAVVLKSIPMGTAISLAVVGVLVLHAVKKVS